MKRKGWQEEIRQVWDGDQKKDRAAIKIPQGAISLWRV